MNQETSVRTASERTVPAPAPLPVDGLPVDGLPVDGGSDSDSWPAAQPGVGRDVRNWPARSVGLVVAFGVLAVVSLLSIWVGANHLSFSTVWRALWHDDGSQAAVIVHDLRIPRTLVGLAVGASLGVAGALTQALTRNALADPGLLGVNLGASASIVVAISFLGVSSPAGYVWFAMAGAAAAASIVYLLGSTGRAAVAPERLIVAGAAVSAVLGAFTYAVVFLDREAFDRLRFWDVGSLAGAGSSQLSALVPLMGVGGVLAFFLAGPLNALALGEDSGRGLGVGVGRTRVLGVVAVALLCGAATAAAGPIIFVGLTVPHVARAICGPDQRWVLAYSSVLAPVLLLGADVVGRLVIAPAELEVGVVTAFVGAPVFIVLCRRQRLGRL